MKVFATWIVTWSLVFSPLAATAEAAPNVPRAERAIGRMLSNPGLRLLSNVNTENLRERVEDAAKAKSREAAVGVGQTLLVMMTLAGVELTVRQIRKNGGAPSAAQIADIAKTVANATVNSPAIWTSIVMSGVFSLANRPALAIAQMLKIPKLRASFAPLLARSITSTIAFVGWDFGAQLWTEASLLLKNQDDYKIANDTFGLSKGVLTTALSTHARSNSKLDQQRSRIAREMMSNMILVLTASSLRAALFSNFIRNDLLTGEFQTTLASFVAAGAIGGAVAGTVAFPGAGTILGLLFGAAGAVVAQFIPQVAKDRITNGYQFLRTRTLEAALASNRNRMSVDTHAGTLNVDAFIHEAASRDDLRSRWITIHWEQMHMEARSDRADLRATFTAHFNAMKEFYVSQLEEMKSLVRSSPAAMANATAHKLLNRELIRCSQMIQFFDALAQAAKEDPKNVEITKSIEAASSRGFDETNAVLAWIQSA